ncbi:MAG: hypothetical protein QMD12_01860 [Candidatus Aenigmarchaeota archaeon]|nr:hypothetical protein [Candidatus Aenigmarchaeota archaeon]
MRILEANYEKKFAKVMVENRLDLWHLANILEPGDLITSKTLRTVFIERWGEREKVERKLVTLTIQLEKMVFQDETNNLRLTGRIVEAPKEITIGSYHTIEARIHSILYIEKKEWKQEHIERLKRAAKGIERIIKPTVIDEFFVHLNKNDGLAVYGFEQVRSAALIGAVKVVLIPIERIKDKRVDELIKAVEEKRGKIKFVARKEPSGEKFCRAYDFAAILRFPIS